MKTICLWRTEKRFRKPDRRKFEPFAQAAALVTESGIDSVLSLSFVTEEEMAQINEAYVGHTGPTDVICFDYRETRDELFAPDDGNGESVDVEIIICPAVAEREARKRSLPYSREAVLYLIHGLLHASGQDDLQVEKKRVMRRKEARCMKLLSDGFDLDRIFPLNRKYVQKDDL